MTISVEAKASDTYVFGHGSAVTLSYNFDAHLGSEDLIRLPRIFHPSIFNEA